MPTRKPNLSKEEHRKFRALILRLQAAGIATGTSGGLLSVPKRLDLRQLEYLFCRVHDLPGGQVVVILLCELMALRAGATVRDCAISLPWGPELDLCDPEYTPWYNDLIQGWPAWPPTVLNRWLTGEVSLPRGRKLTGIIIATGWSPVPAEYPDESLVDIELVASDDQGKPLEFFFKAGVDRSLKHKYERQQRERRAVAASTKRVPIFKREDTETRDEDRQRTDLPFPSGVSVEKPTERASHDVPRDETAKLIGAV
jgi:hypothetical protein